MANTYTQIYLQLVFSPLGHKNIIPVKHSQAVPDLLRDIKAISSKFINEKKWLPCRFNWQEGYGSFSYSHSQIDDVIKYINTQEEHHKKASFKEEYLDLLQKFGVEYDPKYLFEFY